MISGNRTCFLSHSFREPNHTVFPFHERDNFLAVSYFIFLNLPAKNQGEKTPGIIPLPIGSVNIMAFRRIIFVNFEEKTPVEKKLSYIFTSLICNLGRIWVKLGLSASKASAWGAKAV